MTVVDAARVGSDAGNILCTSHSVKTTISRTALAAVFDDRQAFRNRG